MFEVMCQCGKPSKAEMEECACECLIEVGLSSDYMDRYPHMLSGEKHNV